MPPGSPPTPLWSQTGGPGEAGQGRHFQRTGPSPASPTISHAPGVSASTILHLWNQKINHDLRERERWGQGEHRRGSLCLGQSLSDLEQRVFLSLSSHLAKGVTERLLCAILVPGMQREVRRSKVLPQSQLRSSPAHVYHLCWRDPIQCTGTGSPVIRRLVENQSSRHAEDHTARGRQRRQRAPAWLSGPQRE